MYGAILGDIMSLQHKRDNSGTYYLVSRKNKTTDYTVSIIALADALTSDGECAPGEKIRQSLIRWGRAYLNEDYSLHFVKWLAQKGALPINDSDNGAAVRAAILPYIYSDRDVIESFAKLTAEITHSDSLNQQDSLLAANAVFYGMRSSGRNGARVNFESVIGKEISASSDFENIVVEAFVSFLNSTDIVSAIDNAIALGGDISARAVIAGSIAEGFYGAPNSIKDWCHSLLPESMLEILDRVDKVSRRNSLRAGNTEEYLTGMLIENAARRFHRNENETTWNNLMTQIYYGMREGGHLLVPLVVPDRQKIYDGEGSLPDDTTYLTCQTEDGRKFVAAFTDDSPEFSEKYPDIYWSTIDDIFSEIAKDEAEESGIVLNPDNEDLIFTLDKDMLNQILNHAPNENKMRYFNGNIKELSTDAVVTSDFDGFKYTSFEDLDKITAAHFMKETSERDGRYVIYTPLAFYDGDDENVILNCYRSCLDLAKKYHLSSVAFPNYFIISMPLMNKAVKRWFDENKDYGMTVIFASGNDEDINDGKERRFFTVHFRDEEPTEEKNFAGDAKSEAYRNLVERAQTQYPEYRDDINPTNADKQRTRDFAATFNSKKEFWDALKSKGITWNENSNLNINDMWARNALSRAIAGGFEPNSDVNLFASVVDGVNICDEINLYTYWQGFGYAKRTPKIKYLLVAQDWGNFFGDTSEPFKTAVMQMNAGENVPYPFSLQSTTDRNLVELFKILERDITRPCEDVFFTNFCLGYRMGNESGGMTKELMMHDADIFRELCEILEPENILCLGLLTSECAYETLTGESFKKIFGGAKSYNDFLDNHPQIVVHYGDGGTSNFYPLAHCGFYGTNRNRGYDLPQVKADSLFKQRQDWQRIRESQFSK